MSQHAPAVEHRRREAVGAWLGRENLLAAKSCSDCAPLRRIEATTPRSRKPATAGTELRRLSGNDKGSEGVVRRGEPQGSANLLQRRPSQRISEVNTDGDARLPWRRRCKAAALGTGARRKAAEGAARARDIRVLCLK
jgi:hypothetical protein